MEDYNELKDKFKLPDYKEINHFFEISTLDKITLRNIRKKISEKVQDVLSHVQEILQPDTNFANLYEAKAFSDKEREDLYSIFKKLKVLEKDSELIAIDETESKSTEFINTAFKEWKLLLPKLKEFYTKLKEAWLKEDSMQKENSYLG